MRQRGSNGWGQGKFQAKLMGFLYHICFLVILGLTLPSSSSEGMGGSWWMSPEFRYKLIVYAKNSVASQSTVSSTSSSYVDIFSWSYWLAICTMQSQSGYSDVAEQPVMIHGWIRRPLRVANTACHLYFLWLFTCICLPFPLMLRTWYGSDCTSSWVHLSPFGIIVEASQDPSSLKW